jgi:hypothetical protein
MRLASGLLHATISALGVVAAWAFSIGFDRFGDAQAIEKLLKIDAARSTTAGSQSPRAQNVKLAEPASRTLRVAAGMRIVPPQLFGAEHEI